MTSAEGRLLGGRYELGQMLGYGGMAEVFHGRDVRLGREVAVKVLRADLARDPAFLARFRREAQSAASLSHPSIVSVYDTGEDQESTASGAVPTPYIVMEYVEGRTLRDVLRNEGRLLPRRAVEIVAEVCRALDYAHAQGLVHRDIKPGNVMLTRNGQVKVMDFGIARAATASAATVTATAAVIGTAQYLSPEQARGEHTDGRSDVYSTGCLLYELLTGRPPFVGDSPVAVAYQHVRETPTPPSQLDPEITADLDAVVLKAMAKNPDNRYQTAGEMASDLDRVAAGRRVTATPVMAPEARTQQLSPPTTATTVLSPVGLAAANTAAQRRRRAGYITLAAAIVIVIVVAALVSKSLLSSNTSKSSAIPQLVGRTLEDAQKVITDAGFVVGRVDHQFSTTVDKDHVISQSPEPQFGSIKQGAEIDLVVSDGVQMVQIPLNIVGETEAQARSDLSGAGFKNGPPQLVDDLTKDPGTVVGSNPDPGTNRPKGSVVTLKVVNGQSTVPDLTGKTQDEASQALQDVGLLLGTPTTTFVTDPKKVGKVVAQDTPAGKPVPRNTTVTVTIGELQPSPTPSPTPAESPTPSPVASTGPPTSILPTP